MRLVEAHISQIVNSITKKNVKLLKEELAEIVKKFGPDAHRHLVKSLFKYVNIVDNKSNKDSLQQTTILGQELAALTKTCYLSTTLCSILESSEHHTKGKFPSYYLPQLSKLVRLSNVEEIQIGLGLAKSTKEDLSSAARTFVKPKLQEILQSVDPSLPVPFLQQLVLLIRDGDVAQFGISKDTCDAYLSGLKQRIQESTDKRVAALLPLLEPVATKTTMITTSVFETAAASAEVKSAIQDSQTTVDLAEILLDCGYDSCSGVQSVLDILSQVPKKATNASSIARVIGMMNKTITGLNDGMPLQVSLTDGSWEKPKPESGAREITSWEVNHFIDAVKTHVSDIAWRTVMEELDFSGFEVNGLEGFRLIVRAYRRATKAPFPIDILHKTWKNSAGQLSFWRVLSDPQHALVSEVSQLIQLPTRRLSREGLKNTGNHDAAMLPLWSSLDYVKTMMHLGERGHYQEVFEILKPCMSQYPDILALDLAESFRGSWGPLQRDIMSSILKKFLEPGPNASFVLSRVFQAKPEVVTQSILRWYMSEPTNARLVRILDIAQDTKALTELLQVPEPPFVLRLACLASHRGFLNLEKWFQVQVRDHHELILPDSVELVELILEKGTAQVQGQAAPGHKLAALAILQVLSNEINKIDGPNRTRVNVLISKHIKRVDPVDQPNAQPVDTNVANTNTNTPNSNNTTVTATPPSISTTTPTPTTMVPNAIPNINAVVPTINPVASGNSGGEDSFGTMVGDDNANSVSLVPQQTPNNALGQQQQMMQLQEQQQMQQQTQTLNLGAVPTATSIPQPTTSTTTTTATTTTTTPATTDSGNFPDNILSPTVDGTSEDASSAATGGDEEGGKRDDVSDRTFSHAIDDEANSYFGKIYSAQMTITDVVDSMKKFKVSSDQREQDVFACMLRNLFDEYRFFPKYPEKELGITGVLFGCLVQHNLVTLNSLKKALRYVLEALKKEVDSKMYKFGLCALDKFKGRVGEWPQYVQMLQQVPHFDAFPAELKTAINNPISSPATVGATTPDVSVDKVPSATAPSFTSSNVNILMSEVNIPQPPSNVQDKVQMVFNNLSATNLEGKAHELKQAVTREYYPWVAQYLVVKRCSLEPNFHDLYAQFLFKLRQQEIIKGVLRETLDKIHVLLGSAKIADSANSSERKLLKNLGSWLGLQTLARNKPILHTDLAIKDLILFAYAQGPANLLYIVPFVAQILKLCKDSIVFRPPNPWTMGILSVLKEMHQLPKLRLNLKFEVEVLCNQLEISIDSVPSSSILSTIQPMSMLPAATDELSSDRGPSPTQAKSPPQLFPDLIPGVITSIGSYVSISTNITLFSQQPSLKPTVQHALERAIEEIINPVVDRSVKIACISCQKLITKDFALEPDDAKLRDAAHRMVQHLAGNLAMVTAKDPVRMSIGNHLRTLLMGSLPPDQQASTQIQPMIDQAIVMVCNDNLELACAFIKTTAMERAIPEVDEALKDNYSERRHHRTTTPTQPFHDSKNYGAGVSTLPTPLRPKYGGLQPNQLTLYNNLVKHTPNVGGSPKQIKASPHMPSGPSPKLMSTPPTIQESGHPPHEKLLMKLEQFTKLSPTMELASLPNNPQIHGTMRELLTYIGQSSSRSDLVVYLHQRLLLRLLEVDLIQNTLLRDVYLDVLTQLQESYRTVAIDITKSFKLMSGEHKFNSDIVSRLLQSRLLDPQELDTYLVKAMDGGRNFQVVVFVEETMHQCFLSDRKSGVPSVDDFSQTFDLIAQMATTSHPPREAQVALMNAVSQMRKQLSPPQSNPQLQQQQHQQQQHQQQGAPQQQPPQQQPPQHANTEGPDREPYNDPPGLRDQVRYLFEEWMRLHEVEKAGVIFVTKLMHPQIAMLRTDDISTRFFRLCADQAIGMSIPQPPIEGAEQQPIRYHGVDAFTKLIVVLLTHFGESTKVALLNKVLKTIISVLVRDHERLGPRFNQKPYFRLLCNLLFDVHASDETISFQVLTGFTHAFHVLRPSLVPAFSFAWLELISHRNFMPKLLLMKDTKGWQMLQRLLIDLFSYTLPFFEVGKMSDAIRLLYKGTLRMLLVLLHDFPEFLAGYHFALCDVIPTRCIQMRNLILSAFPRNMRLPDPFTPNLKIDLLPEIAQAPRFLSLYIVAMQNTTLRQDIDTYFQSGPNNSTLLNDLCKRFLLPSDDPSGKTYNVPLLNSFVLYVGIKSIEENKSQQESDVVKGPAADIFLNVASNMDLEGRYLFLNAIANQLRYPNSHTHYFSCMLLHLFAEADKEITLEQITRVLLERLIVNRPHPWGLLITFVELIQNRTYDFWRHNFVHCAPEIQRLFDSVARSCHTASRVAGEQVATN